jgi:hypothetical protein
VEFQVFKKGKIVKDFAVHGAYIFGTDGIAVRRTQISFNNGTISCAKPNMETAGLALLWPVEGFGKVLLPTTCLPDRSRPYILNLELARAKLKQVVNKREDWSFFGGIEGLEDIAKEAQDLFIKAIQNISDTSLASKLADESLKKAMVLSESMALKQAESLFEARGKNRGFGRGCLGCSGTDQQCAVRSEDNRAVRLRDRTGKLGANREPTRSLRFYECGCLHQCTGQKEIGDMSWSTAAFFAGVSAAVDAERQGRF